MNLESDLPNLRTVRQPRHPGISNAVCDSFSEAAEVCLARHHQPPRTVFTIECCGSTSDRGLVWREPDDTARRAWHNTDDATRDAAYIVSIAAVENELGLVALSRAEIRTGADYYVGQPGSTDLEEAIRLEVAGTDQDIPAMRSILRKKQKQAISGNSPLPALASVVGFRESKILVSHAEASDAEQ